MRSRAPLFLFILITSIFVLPVVTHAYIPFFGPIIPDNNNRCAANWGMLILVINNIISLVLTLEIVLVAPIMLAYSGFLYVSNSYNPTGLSKAKGMLFNVIGGIVVSLAAWMIVGALMAVLYDSKHVGQTWQSLITGGGDMCLKIAAGLSQVEPGVGVSGIDAAGQTILNFDPNAASDGACSAAALKTAIPSLTTAQANTFACLAKYESTCGTSLQNFNWGKGSSAYGAFQVLLSDNHAAYENSACLSAAGVAGPLNCQNGFRGGNPISGSTVAEQCKRAASNLSCSLAAAAYLQKRQGWDAWKADKSSSGQSQCIAKYAGGTNI